MKVDRRFHCFGCQADGDVIDFVSRLEAVSPRKPPYSWHRTSGSPMRTGSRPAGAKKPKPRQKSPEQQFRKQSATASVSLPIIDNLLRGWKRDYAPHSPEEVFHPAVCGSLAEARPCGISAGCAALPGHGGTSGFDYGLRKGSDKA